jgi:hypothetical protein
MTVIEINPHRWGWRVFEAPGVEPVFPEKRQAIGYAETRACFRSRVYQTTNSAPFWNLNLRFERGSKARPKK